MVGTVDYKAMGRRVRALRVERGLTQEQLAEYVDVSTSFIGHIERGEKQSSLDTMCRLATYLKTSMDYLVLGKQNRCNQQLCSLYTALSDLLRAHGME